MNVAPVMLSTMHAQVPPMAPAVAPASGKMPVPTIAPAAAVKQNTTSAGVQTLGGAGATSVNATSG